MQTFHQRLVRRFRKQREFTAGYSPLTSALCLQFARWLEEHREPFTTRLLRAAAGRGSFEVPMLLCAALHFHVLKENPAAGELAGFYPGTGGVQPLDPHQLGAVLEQTVLSLEDELHAFIKMTNVQTNETARGICWLLPMQYTAWEKIDLLELGASAGLNLVADKYCYRLMDESGGRFLDVGRENAAPFPVECNSLPAGFLSSRALEVGTRIGCDKSPFYLDSRDDELRLASFIWPDQVERMRKLTEGIAVLSKMKRQGCRPKLCGADLPGDLPGFLHGYTQEPLRRPVVLFNTYVTGYLDQEKGNKSLRQLIEQWASGREQDTLWLQMELPKKSLKPPALGWLLWQADLWHHGEHLNFHLAWIHPHATKVQWLPGICSWAEFWKEKN